ncbi:MAG TPA: hypothetical protein VEX13_11970 [Chloroflexia bacterium]|nr:hypothetical protein [Chloroflexia bacterium]
MKSEALELEGTWEEVAEHANELAGRRVRLIVLPNEAEDKGEHDGKPEAEPGPEPGFSTARSLLKYAGTWLGDDLEECLQAVYDNRSQAKF